MRYARVAAAATVSAAIMLFLALGGGPVPPLGSTLNPAGGIWGAATDAKPVGPRTAHLVGLRAPVEVRFDPAGVPAVRAGSDPDLFHAQGYLHAAFRLTQLDLMRRMATGRLAELNGPGALDLDKFQLESGLLRTARAQWEATAPGSPAAQALRAYSRGVNDRLAQLRRGGAWPAVFTLTGVYPPDWTPVDSLAVQGLLSQNLSYTTSPLYYALLRDSLGRERTMQWFPVVAANPQHPYDPGPYRDLGVDPLPLDANANAAVPAAAPDPAPPPPAAGAGWDGGAGVAAVDLLARVGQVPGGQAGTYGNSNAWAANGPAVTGGRSLLAGDPHLQLTLPSFWYQLGLRSPDTDVTGASLVGLPGVVIGRNAQISWSLTNVQNQSTVFYVERTSPTRPGQYYWRGAWRDMVRVEYTIPVRGADPVTHPVDLTVHGPVMTQVGQTTSVSWMGNYPSDSLAAILAVNKAQDYRQFRRALRDWHAPTLNFAYADSHGDIAVIAAGHFPVVAAGEPWFPLPGTGEYDIVGTIPFDAAPQVHNPPEHIVATANQRPVTADYPYYIGTTMNAFDVGYRAARIYDHLDGRRSLTGDDFVALQNDVTDHLAGLIRPALTEALAGAPLSGTERAALDQLEAWDLRMTESSTGATIWWTFWSAYLSEVFQPWWDAAGVPTGDDRPALEITPARASLSQNLQVWTLHDQDNPAFSPPGQPAGDAATAMRAAFTEAVSELSTRLGPQPATWRWGRIHTRQIPAVTGHAALGHGPAPARGSPWTVDAAAGGMESTFGPSWRMVVEWTGPATARARAVYPGGQSENPASDWYQNLVPLWWDGKLRDMPMVDEQSDSTIEWTLLPGG